MPPAAPSTAARADASLEGDTLTIASLEAPPTSFAYFTDTGKIFFSPGPAFTGQETFAYTLINGAWGAPDLGVKGSGLGFAVSSAVDCLWRGILFTGATLIFSTRTVATVGINSSALSN